MSAAATKKIKLTFAVFLIFIIAIKAMSISATPAQISKGIPIKESIVGKSNSLK